MQTEKKLNSKRLRNTILVTLVLVLMAIIIAVLAKKGIAIPCVLNKFTGLKCAGCGNTRAAVSLLSLDFVSAFKYNPLSFLEFFYLIWIYVISAINYVKGEGIKYHFPLPLIDYVCCGAIILWTVIRNFL